MLTVDKECLAVLLALKNFERYMFGVPVTIITDHNCLKWLMTMSPHNSRLMRLPLCLQRYYNVDIKFKPVLIIQMLMDNRGEFLNNYNHAILVNVLAM